MDGGWRVAGRLSCTRSEHPSPASLGRPSDWARIGGLHALRWALLGSVAFSCLQWRVSLGITPLVFGGLSQPCWVATRPAESSGVWSLLSYFHTVGGLSNATKLFLKELGRAGLRPPHHPIPPGDSQPASLAGFVTGELSRDRV